MRYFQTTQHLDDAEARSKSLSGNYGKIPFVPQISPNDTYSKEGGTSQRSPLIKQQICLDRCHEQRNFDSRSLSLFSQRHDTKEQKIASSRRSRARCFLTDSAILRRQTHYPCSLLLGSRIVLCTVISIHGVEARVGKVSSSYVNHFRLQNKHTAADICMIANCLQRCRCCLIHICDPL